MIVFWIALALYTVGAVFFGARTAVRTIRALRQKPLSANATGFSPSEARLILFVGLACGLLFAASRNALLWPWDLSRRLRGKRRPPEPPFRGTFSVGEPGPELEQRRCLYCVQEGDDLEQILLYSGCTIESVAALNGGTVDWTPGSTVTLPRPVCVYLVSRSPREYTLGKAPVTRVH